MADTPQPKVHWMTPDGDDDSQQDVVACAIFATVDIQGERSGTGAMGVHEYVVARRRYRELHGNLTMLPEWPRGQQRMVRYTRAQYETQYERMSDDYVRITKGGQINTLEDIYGPKANSALLERMRKCYDVYNEWLAGEEQRAFVDKHGYTPMSEEIWERMCSICDPSRGTAGISADVLEIPESAEEQMLKSMREAERKQQRAAKAAEVDRREQGKSSDEIKRTVKGCAKALREAVDGLTTRDAEALAKAMRDLEWRTASIDDADWAKTSIGDDMAIRGVLVDAMADYLDATDPAPQSVL